MKTKYWKVLAVLVVCFAAFWLGLGIGRLLDSDHPPSQYSGATFVCQFERVTGQYKTSLAELSSKHTFIIVWQGERTLMLRRSQLKVCEKLEVANADPDNGPA